MKAFVFMCGVMFLFSVHTISHAATLPHTSPYTERIQLLMNEVNRLQAILHTLLIQGNSYIPDEYATSLFYTGEYEAIYAVRDTSLRPPNGAVPRNHDQHIWNAVLDILGENDVDAYIEEFRIYNDENAEFDSYVEKRAGEDGWTIAVNSASFDLRNKTAVQDLREILVHEYAHLLLYYESSSLLEFEDIFWTSNDEGHAQDVSYANAQDAEELRVTYFEKNTTRFVSEYATTDPEEDFVESFTYFVFYNIPANQSIVSRKMRFFYAHNYWVDLRRQILNRLEQ